MLASPGCEGIVGESPLKKIPVELLPSLTFWNKSNLMATLLGMPCGPPGWSEP